MTTENKRYKHAQRSTESTATSVVKAREIMHADDTKRWVSTLEDGTVLREGGYTNRYVERWANMADFLTDAASDNTNAVISTTITLTGNTTIPANVHLDFRKGGSIALAGFTLTINGTFSAGNFQIFSGSGSVVPNGGGILNAKWWGAVGNGIADDTAEIQATINAARLTGAIAYIPTGTYLVTDTINIYDDTQVLGDFLSKPDAGSGAVPLSTTIQFTPASLKPLFKYILTFGVRGTILNTSISGLYLVGDDNFAENAIETAVFTVGARFENLGITNFETGIKCNGTLTCSFNNVYCSFNTVQDVLYVGNVETSDVWNSCTFSNAPIGVKMNGIVVGVRFDGCLFEGIDDYGMDLDRGVQSIMVTDSYTEDVPDGGNPESMAADAAMFRVGHLTNATTSTTLQLIIKGGFYAGHSTGTASPSFIDINYSNGVIIGGCSVSRYTNGISTDATNTKNNSVIMLGLGGISVTTIIDDYDKVTGIYPNSGDMTQASFNQVAKIQDITATIGYYLNSTSGIIALSAGGVADGPVIRSDSSSPVNSLNAPIGSLYLRNTGGVNTSVYIKESGSPTNLAITSITSVGTTATVTTTANHGISSTSYVTISGATQAEYNGTYLATQTGADTFTYTFAGSGTSPATGTIVYNFGVTGWAPLTSEDLTPTFTDVTASLGYYMSAIAGGIYFSAGGVADGSAIRSGSGTPESSVTAPPGSIWLGGSGGAGNSLFVKESGTGNTGWRNVQTFGTVQTIASADIATTDIVSCDIIITGTTGFSRFETDGLPDRFTIRVIFTGALIITNGAAVSGTLYGIKLPGSTDFTTADGDVLTFMLDNTGGYWYTTSVVEA